MDYEYPEEGLDLEDTAATAPEEEDPFWWLDVQAWTLFLGLLCGLLCQILVRYYSSVGIPSTSTETVPARPSAASPSSMGAARSSLMSSFAGFSTNNKMALVVRTDLGMTKGKVAAQCAHAAIMCYKKSVKEAPKAVTQWEMFGQTKVTLKAENEDVMMELVKRARARGIVACLVHDAGHTQVAAGSATVLGIGPAPAELVDKVTGHLKLY